MDLIKDDQLDLFHKGVVNALSRDDVPLLGGRNNDLGLLRLLSR